ncbi:dihydroxyacetone kinase family protein [Reyranella sp.]|uniref:dihydroxyacetone kinase family protein n=1 Tax=Reyranella sp. TaxID=1929291 RepID=UPI00120E9540|nr:dihydroxyacetone kinase family protein [Reyranella sp.]TAJ86249.1 MAG: dihydroxyacetone kinase subunit DhaK [Reyranella sp.]
MKKLINDPRAVVREMLEGHVGLHAGQTLLADENVVLRADLEPPAARQVAIISGGGSGHEPAHTGYVGAGMLHAAVAGDVFTSPSTDAVLAAIRAASGPAGALLIVKNYTGDRLNFGLAAELARAEGIPVETVVVADDVALRDTVAPERRRGLAGTVLVHKVAGAASAAGLDLAAVAAEARQAASALGTMGVALGACTVPGGSAGFTLAADEMELGLGIHGEAGVRRAKLVSADEIVDQLLASILSDLAPSPGARTALLVNGLGGTPPMELAIVARKALAQLRASGLHVARAWSGNLMTALEMPGVSLSLLIVDDSRLARLDAATAAPAWPGQGRLADALSLQPAPPAPAPTTPILTPTRAGRIMRQSALKAAEALAAAEVQLTELDAVAGDGDLGLSMTRAASAIRAMPASDWATPSTALKHLAAALGRAIAGSSGPFYATALVRAARGLSDDPGPQDWAEALDAAAAAIAELGGAKPGDRTMLDALVPAATAFRAALEAGRTPADAWVEALDAARDGTAATAGMYPRVGRAAYLGDRALGHPDAGATALTIWLTAITPT